MIGENGTPATPDWTCEPICTRCDICETRQQAFWRHGPAQEETKMPRSMQEIVEQADELCRRFEDYEPRDGDLRTPTNPSRPTTYETAGNEPHIQRGTE